ncbi:MAG: efflux RND transporter periplasmic adaptor subunit [Prevotella sp.]
MENNHNNINERHMGHIRLSLVVGAALALMTSCHNHEADHKAEEAGHGSHDGETVLSQKQAEAAGVQTETVKPGDFMASLKTSGVLLSGQGDEQTIASTAAGIVSMRAGAMAEGSRIGRGERIATVTARGLQDGDPYGKARAEYEAAEKAYKRAAGLAKDNIISQREYEAARRDYDAARSAYDSQRQHVGEEGVSIISPIGGYVKALLVRQGDYVSVGQPIAIVTEQRRMRLRADVPVSHMAEAGVVTGARFRMAGSDAVRDVAAMNGTVVGRGQSVTEGTAYIPVTFEMDNVGDVVAGAYADVWLLTATRKNVISVPTDAIMESQGEKYVFVQVENDAYMRRTVETGGCDGMRVEIVKGLSKGEKVVTRGANAIRLAGAATAIPEHNHSH